MDLFRTRLEETRPATRPDRWTYVPYDQLTLELGSVARYPTGQVGLVLVESLWKGRRRPYHKQKLALVLANQRHFALEAHASGVPVRYLTGAGSPAEQLASVADEVGPLTCMIPAERELRANLQTLVERELLNLEPHEGWLTLQDDFAHAGPPGGPWRQDAFYRAVRRRTGVLMDGSKPVGGKFSFDAENRQAWPGEPPAPEPPLFEPDATTLEVAALVERVFAEHPGSVDPGALPATCQDAEALWAWARAACLPWFGPFEDAMSHRTAGLFHTRISPLLNLHRLLPRRIVDDALALDLPLASKEGFIRQVLGWREFVRHVHEATDGFRALPDVAVNDRPGDGGFGRWRGEAWTSPAGGGGGASPLHLDAQEPLPAAWWGEPSGLACLDEVVAQVLASGWTHHIPRLMVLSNLATLLDLSPRELTDWFWVCFVDAFDWVVEPNVLAMGTFATGEVMTTKPYVSGAAYIDRMSDFCGTCAFDPKKDCPVTRLYWAFLGRHRKRLEGNGRLALPLASQAKRSPETQREDARVFERVRELLREGPRMHPEAIRSSGDR